MINHQDNFITSLTSGISAGATTAPLASIPTIDAPFYLAFDATNLNGNYEIRMVSSKTATNVNFLACSSPHSADEEVRMVIPSWEADKIYQSPQGFLLNGKIVPSVGSNNLTVALKTLAGTDPSALNPVHIRIGDTIRTITSALSVTANAGTNWCNAGSSELATKEIDYFVYLGYNATDGVTIGFSRIPYANLYSDFSATTTNEKYCAISTITNAVAGNTYENVGRFSATLSAGAGYTWSVPTFTSENLRQVPTFETRRLTYSPVYTASNSMQFNSVTTLVVEYKLSGHSCSLQIQASGTVAGTPSYALRFSLPMSGVSRYSMNGAGLGFDNGASISTACGNLNLASTTVLEVYKYNASNWTAGTAYIGAGLTYEI